MISAESQTAWRYFFVAAALFNFAIGIPLFLARRWTFAIAFRNPSVSGLGLAPDLWADFGFCVALIGLGYLFIAVDPARERSLIWLGVFAKAFDVITLTWRTMIGVTNAIVLLPAAADAVFLAFFLIYLVKSPRR